MRGFERGIQASNDFGGMALSIIKTISLDEKTATIAKSLPNFSHFVRDALLRHALGNTAETCARPKGGVWGDRCNPLAPPHCFACWPCGKPSKGNVKAAYQGAITIDQLITRTYEENHHLIEPPKSERKTPPLKGNLWQKLLGKLKY